MHPLRSLSAILSLLALLVFPTIAKGETEESIKGFSVWQAHGGLQVSGTETNTYSATIIGRLYIDTDKGPVDTGILSCPILVRVKLTDRGQSGSGTCTISTKDGGQVFLNLACTGIYLIGCSGEATITGGNDRFKGITGSGKFTIRSDLAEPAVQQASDKARQEPIGALPSDIGGILFFDALHYKLP
jgi:hypothetical protein